MKTLQLLILTLCVIITFAGKNKDKNKNKKSKNKKSKGDMKSYTSTTTTTTTSTSAMNPETTTDNTDLSSTYTSMIGTTGSDSSSDPCKGKRRRKKKKGNGRGRGKNKYSDSDSSSSGWDKGKSKGKGKGKGKRKGKKYDCDDEDRSSSGWWAYSTTEDDMSTTEEFDTTEFNITDIFPNMTEVTDMITTGDDTTSTIIGPITSRTTTTSTTAGCDPLDVDLSACVCFDDTNCPGPRCMFLIAECVQNVTFNSISLRDDGGSGGNGAEMKGVNGVESGGLDKGVNMSSNTTLWMIGVGSAAVVTVLLCVVFGVIVYMRKGNKYDNVACGDNECEGCEMNGRATPTQMGQSNVVVENVVIKYESSEDENECIMDGDGCTR